MMYGISHIHTTAYQHTLGSVGLRSYFHLQFQRCYGIKVDGFKIEMCIRDSVYGAERFYYNWSMYDFFAEEGKEDYERNALFVLAKPE